MIGDRELAEFRDGYYRLLATLFARKPPPELLESLRQGLSERIRACANLNGRLADGWRDVGTCLETTERVQEVGEEFTVLFVGPRPALHPYESYYLADKFYAEPLAAVRNFLHRVGMAKSGATVDPEDGIAFECELMARLIDRQREASDPDAESRWTHLQGEFLKHHLLVWAPQFAVDLSSERRARFYRGVGKMLHGFLELEREVIAPWGPEEFKTFEEARQALAPRGQWRGPLFELPERPRNGADPASPGGV